MTTPLIHRLVCVVVLILAVLGIGFDIDPVQIVLNNIDQIAIGLLVSAIVGYGGFKMLDVGSVAVVDEATVIVTKNQWTPALIPGIIAFGTSLSELGFVIISTLKEENEILAHSIIGSDGFQIGCLFFLCVAVARSSEWDARLLRADMWLLTLMSYFVVSAMLNGFTRIAGVEITVTALAAAYQFLVDAPPGILDMDEEVEAEGSIFNLVSGFAMLLLGTIWFFNAIIYVGGVFGVPAFVLGIIGAVVTSAGEIFTSVPLVKSGKKGLFFACIALAGSNAFDTSFLGIASIIRPFRLESTFNNVLPAIVTMILTAILLIFVHRQRVPRTVGYVLVPVYLASFILLAVV
ncbi:MAG: hypothetical protein F6K30_27740 [Cyanothece sp. SIO2G6]|nr:hypothetical protein [Cyanothece sp. SIO2G6]